MDSVSLERQGKMYMLTGEHIDASAQSVIAYPKNRENFHIREWRCPYEVSTEAWLLTEERVKPLRFTRCEGWSVFIGTHTQKPIFA